MSELFESARIKGMKLSGEVIETCFRWGGV